MRSVLLCLGYLLYGSIYVWGGDDGHQAFPEVEDVIEMERLSHVVYKLRHYSNKNPACNATNKTTGQKILPPELECYLYRHDISQGTQVMVVSNKIKKYTAVIYAGTDNFRTALSDGDLLMKQFGSSGGEASILLPRTALVHAGFDNAVFHHNLDRVILDIVAQETPQDHRVFMTGHSLGAADAVLLAAAMVLRNRANGILQNVTCINFGCPRIGNKPFMEALDRLPELKIWRYVLGSDLVPRLPKYPFRHVGHTIQLSRNQTKAYYHHMGDRELGYAGVPPGWESRPFLWVPGALSSHRMTSYVAHIESASSNLAVERFEMRQDGPVAEDDDYYVDPPESAGEEIDPLYQE